MQNNNTMLPDKVSEEYFWKDDISIEVAREAAKRWNNYSALVHMVEYIATVDEPQFDHDKMKAKAKQLLNELKP